MKKFNTIISFFISEKFILPIVLIVSGVMHGWNMFHYPYFENDEGVYFSQAWSFLSQGKLAPYTYWYDHAPLGWIFTSLWIFITHGLFTFGFSLNSARVFMLVIHLCVTFLLFKITKKLTGSAFAATISVIFIIFSPLAIYFQRRLLLDNIMTFWLLLSLYFILYGRQRLSRVLLSAFAFGISVLSKENAIFFLPVYAFLVGSYAHKKHRLFAISYWLLICGLFISFYPLYALLKGEFFPTGTLLGGTAPHVSLLGSLEYQSSRGTGLPFWNPRSDFRYNLAYWIQRDPLLMILGSITFFIQGIMAFFKKNSRIVFLLTLSMLLFLASGKLVINFYVIPLIPLFGLCIGMTAFQITSLLRKIHPAIMAIAAIALIGFFINWYAKDIFVQQALTVDETTPQLQAVNWVKKNIPDTSTIAIDYYSNLDLRYNAVPNAPTYPHAYWYWKVDFDPAIKQTALKDNYKNIQYMILTAQMVKDIGTYDKSTSLLAQVLNSSSIVAFFGDQPPGKNFNLQQYTASHPNGNWVAIYKLNSVHDVLTQTWQSYKKTFITSEGQVLDPQTKATDDRQVGYTLLRAVLENDQSTFHSVLSWSQSHMQSEETSLFMTSYGKVKNTGTTTESDELIAYALAQAGIKWHSKIYIEDSLQIIDGIWNDESIAVDDQRYIVAGNWTSDPDYAQFVIDPASLSPAIYRSFAQIDHAHDWKSIVNSSYTILNACSSALLDGTKSANIPPNWCTITKEGNIMPAEQISDTASDYSYEAYRVAWNIALDEQIANDPRASAYLQHYQLFLQQWQTQKTISSNYTHTGKAINKNESIDQYSSLMTAFMFTSPQTSQAIYDKKIAPAFTGSGAESFWGNNTDIFDQNWVWLGIFLAHLHNASFN